uniref:Putative ovule protein n=1 Tax=Solanum chacoense TaxID=4108 RepID=A0A0V0GTI2_SOLCH
MLCFGLFTSMHSFRPSSMNSTGKFFKNQGCFLISGIVILCKRTSKPLIRSDYSEHTGASLGLKKNYTWRHVQAYNIPSEIPQ